MRQVIVASSLIALVVTAGCFPPVTLHPLYTEAQTVEAPGLIGSWGEDDSVAQYQFEQTDERTYEFTGSGESGEKFGFEVRLLDLEDALFMDFYPNYYDVEIDDFYKLHLLPVHSFYKIDLRGDTLTVYMIDSDQLKKSLEEDPGLVANEVHEEQLLLTGETSALQAFAIGQMKVEGAYQEAVTLVRVKQ